MQSYPVETHLSFPQLIYLLLCILLPIFVMHSIKYLNQLIGYIQLIHTIKCGFLFSVQSCRSNQHSCTTGIIKALSHFLHFDEYRILSILEHMVLRSHYRLCSMDPEQLLIKSLTFSKIRPQKLLYIKFQTHGTKV